MNNTDFNALYNLGVRLIVACQPPSPSLAEVEKVCEKKFSLRPFDPANSLLWSIDERASIHLKATYHGAYVYLERVLRVYPRIVQENSLPWSHAEKSNDPKETPRKNVLWGLYLSLSGLHRVQYGREELLRIESADSIPA